MALGRSCSSSMTEEEQQQTVPFELVRYSSFGRKRITVSLESWDMETGPVTPTLKRHCSEAAIAMAAATELESLPQELLVKVICGVNHDDLKQLLFVSKPIAEATSIAREIHFAYRTPKKVRAFRSPAVDFEMEDIETPGAPRAVREYKLLSRKVASDLSVSLFSSPEPAKRKGSLFSDMEIDEM
ncbi:F-box protein SKIP27 [Linum grandiflorum]